MSQNLPEENYIRSKIFDARKSIVRRYADLTVGSNASYWELAKHEMITCLFGGLPGAFGLLIRKKVFRLLFKQVGRNVVFGRNLTIRNGRNIVLGDDVIIDDGCVLDARGAGPEGVQIGSRVILNRDVSIQAKIGPISIGDDTDVGMHSGIHSQGGVRIGKQVTLGGGCKISGGIFQIQRTSTEADSPEGSFASREQTRSSRGPVVIGDKTLVGMGSMFLDGVEIGEGCIVGAGSVNVRSAPPYSVIAGVPARVLRTRDGPAIP